ncbi:YlxR family protein [Candidatus Peregrinibacteria bacterium]|nr:YlxR family protein [Candidatus Peregrinibacteria bacterium]
MNPIRTCIACRTRIPQQELVRFEIKGGKIEIKNKGKGRGAYLCPKTSCLEKLLKNPKLMKHFLHASTLPDDLIAQLKQVCTH